MQKTPQNLSGDQLKLRDHYEKGARVCLTLISEDINTKVFLIVLLISMYANPVMQSREHASVQHDV